jgi:hypothetical protein
VRWVDHAPDKALDADGEVDQIVNHLLATWPPE